MRSPGKRSFLWIGLLVIGLLVTGLTGFRIMLKSHEELWRSQSQAMAFKSTEQIQRHINRLLLLQGVMDSYLKLVLPDFKLPVKHKLLDSAFLYRPEQNKQLLILSPGPISPGSIEYFIKFSQGAEPYIRHLSKEYNEVSRFYIRLKSGHVLEFYFGPPVADSAILNQLTTLNLWNRPLAGVKDTVFISPSFIGKVSKKELSTLYTALVFNGTIIGELCLDIQTNYYNVMLNTEDPDTRVVLIESTGTILSSNVDEFNSDERLINIFDYYPGLKEVVSLNSATTNRKTFYETKRTYAFLHKVAKNLWVGLLTEKQVIRWKIILLLIPYMFAFVALWAALWAYSNQRIITRKLKRLSKELELAKLDADSANAAKSSFLANMSHEIRTPMNAIIGFTQILRRMVTDPAQSNYLRAINTSSNTLLSLINDILDLSKIEAGKLEIRPEPFSIRGLITEVESLFRTRVEEKGLHLVAKIDPELPDNLVGDDLRLRQVLLNFMSNALKFTDKGEITLEAALLKANTDTVDIALKVSDTGIGIPEDQLQKVFGAFDQIDNHDTRKYGGTGLGLAITQKLVSLMGGRITVESSPKKGSTFSVILPGIPVSDSEVVPSSNEPDQQNTIQFNPATLLIVDDVANNRAILTGLLEGSGLGFIEASNGKEALDLMARRRPDLVLTDLRMPVMDGYELARHMKENASLGNIPIVAVSASAFDKDIREVMSRGFNTFLRKPVLRNELLAALSSHLPHTVVNSEPDPHQAPEKATDQLLNAGQMKELAETLSGEIQTLTAFARQKQSMQTARQLLLLLKPLCLRYDWKPLMQATESLQLSVDTFDIGSMDKALREIESLIGKTGER